MNQYDHQLMNQRVVRRESGTFIADQILRAVTGLSIDESVVLLCAFAPARSLADLDELLWHSWPSRLQSSMQQLREIACSLEAMALIRYALRAQAWAQADCVSLNHGYIESGPPLPHDGQSISLYRELTRKRAGEPTHIVDVGCGVGTGTLDVAHRFPRAAVVGIDILASHVERARSSIGAISNVQFYVGNALSLPFDNGVIDYVLSVEATHGFVPLVTFLEEAHRVLRNGGQLAIADAMRRGSLRSLVDQAGQLQLRFLEHRSIKAGVMHSLEMAISNYQEIAASTNCARTKTLLGAVELPRLRSRLLAYKSGALDYHLAYFTRA